MEIRQALSKLGDEIIRLRRDFHMHPELGFEEFRTAGIIASYLQGCGMEVTQIAKTGVVGLLKGGQPGRTLLLRADMDALPIQEQTDLPYTSVCQGKMHACGHDGHIAMLLAAAKVLSGYKEKLQGNIKFVFQPNEEDAGAYLMIEEGIMENPPVDAAAGAHLWPALPSGYIDLREGPVMAASHYFYLTVKGKGGHAGCLHDAIDSILVSANIIQSVQAVQTRETDALTSAAIVFTRINAGSNTTIVPEQVEMQGSIRFLFTAGEAIKEKFERIVAHTCAAHRASYELRYKVGNEILINAPEMTEIARKAAEAVLGSRNNLTSGIQSMGGEDFSEFARRVPGVFYFIGSGNKEKRTDYSIHHPCFDIDEDALLIGAEMHIRTALLYLGGQVLTSDIHP